MCIRDRVINVCHFLVVIIDGNLKSIMHLILCLFIFVAIIDGNLKSIMRLILALAAHFKPSSVKQSSASCDVSPSTSRQSIAGIAQVSTSSQHQGTLCTELDFASKEHIPLSGKKPCFDIKFSVV